MNMELYYLRGSPWSLRTIWTLSLLPEDTLKDVTFKAVLSANSLKSKVSKCGFHKEKDEKNDTISLPMFFYKNENKEKIVIREGFDIVEFFCERTIDKSAFAKNFLSNKEEMFEWSTKSDKVGRYFRNVFSAVGYDFAQYLAPKFLTYAPFIAKNIGKYLLKDLNKKYGSLTDDKTFDEVKEIMKEAEDSLETSKYLSGDEFGFSDIVIFSMFEFSHPLMFDPPIVFGALSENSIKKNKELNFKKDYENVFTAHKRIFEENLLSEVVETCKLLVWFKVQHKL